jgi:hypothetical protein
MKLDVENGWYYVNNVNPYNGEVVLRIYYKKELKHQQEMNYRAGERTVETIIEKIKKGKK